MINIKDKDYRKEYIGCYSIIYFFLLVFFITASPCMAVTVKDIKIDGLHSISEEEMLDIMAIHKNSEITPVIVRDGIKRAFLKGIFEDISVRVSNGENADVSISVKERDIIRKIKISGDYGIPGKKLKELFIFGENDVIRYDLLNHAKDDLKNKLALYGYPDSKVEISIEKTKKEKMVDILLNVDTRRPLIIKDVKISGDPDESADELRLYAGDIFNQHMISEKMKRLKETYKKKGYYAPVVGPYSYTDGILEIMIKKGKRLSIKFEGNQNIPEKKLMKEIPFFETETINDEAIEEVVSRMMSLYYSGGFASAQIAPVKEEDDKNINITFFIFEGKKIKTGEIRFKGTTLPEEKLKGVMLLREGEPYNPETIEKDIDALKDLYSALGYLGAEIKDIDIKLDIENGTAMISITIHEGEKTIIESIDIKGITDDLKDRIFEIVRLNKGDPYNEVDLSDARLRILDFYNNLGYSNIDVVINRNFNDHKVSILFDVVEGKKVFFGNTLVIGNRKTEYKVIKRELVHKEGQPFRFQTVAEGRQKLYRLGLFSDIEIETKDIDDGIKDVIVKVKEGNAGAVEFGLGYAEYEKYRGFFEISYRNLWGMNRLGLFRTEVSSLESRYAVQFQEPWFMGYELPFRTMFTYEKKKDINIDDRSTRYSLQRYSLTSGVEKKIGERLKAELYYEYSLVRTSDIQPDVVLSREDTGTLAISSIRPALIYDTRDNPFNPSRGVLAGISLKASSMLLFSESNFAKFTLYGSIFQRINKRTVFAISLRGGIAYGFQKTEQLPIVERFFLGGRSTVRGYAQDMLGPKGADGNPTGGNAFLMGNIELRTSIGRGFSLVPFIDMGNVWINARDIDFTDLKYTAGIGLRYNTPVGPLRVDYGVKLRREEGESRGELHFSIGHAF